MYYEIEDELGNVSTLQLKQRLTEEQIEPPQAGEPAPLFYLRNEEGLPVTSLTIGSSDGDSRSVLDLVRFKPLVLSFYCNCWGSYAPKHLEAMKELAPRVEALGGQLLILTNESQKEIGRIARKLDAEVPIYHDKNYNVARSYGVFSETSPIWDRIAGISDEVFTPSLFVLGRDRRIGYAFVDENFDNAPDLKAILKAIYDGR
ncbi:peroxiredoxin family protein [Dyadobacter fermentans]|uniref:Alkyl hydroperoxide reductase/ Thiol specific antioxidant/ Mal allergen n=1 Tax=Dyadobacter fermentans (strain ATCC 700827 / DSM 18053 / CIP 107007 / KCTC 52180 / NS114) TaxID=471854 RepID=C6W4E9_DYAFD|nr:redoxin domain-containing protein [Dyadobacter fermentans]ACT94050.1 alkyl hydroperoxide reductase/ Thiol specific antioxidant/ Mal allergen [Dyadobacter fermentans DSM 18053]